MYPCVSPLFHINNRALLNGFLFRYTVCPKYLSYSNTFRLVVFRSPASVYNLACQRCNIIPIRYRFLDKVSDLLMGVYFHQIAELFAP